MTTCFVCRLRLHRFIDCKHLFCSCDHNMCVAQRLVKRSQKVFREARKSPNGAKQAFLLAYLQQQRNELAILKN